MVEYVEIMDPFFSAWKHLFLKYIFIYFDFISSEQVFNCFESLIGAMHHHFLLHVFYSNYCESLVCVVHFRNDIVIFIMKAVPE